MSVDKMKLVNIVGRLKDFDRVVRNCCINGNFHPEQSNMALEKFEEFVPIDEPNPYARHLRIAVDTAVHSDISLAYNDFSSLSMSDEELGNYVEKIRDEIDALNQKVRELTLRSAHLRQGIEHLDHIRDFEINLDDLFQSNFVNYRFGRFPKESYEKLNHYDEDELLIFFPQGEDSKYYWGFYVTLKNNAEKIDDIFASLYFERVNIIEEAHGTPQQAISSIEKILGEVEGKLEAAKKEVDAFWEKNRETFLRAYSKLKYLSDSFDLRKYAEKCGDSFYIFGWVPLEEIPAFQKQFDHMKYVDCIVEDENAAENIEPPTRLSNKRVAKPFESFIEVFGLPSYNEIDPTPLMALSYSFAFGVMFGDLGQGLVVLLLGLFLSIRKKAPLGGVMARCGVFSMLFGTLYNSFFGYEDMLPIPTVLPVHNDHYINYVLLAAVGYGFVIILTCMVFNILNGVRQKNFAKIFFSNNGISGIVFYVSAVLAVVMLMMFNKNILSAWFIVCLIVVPLVLMMFGEPLGRLLERRKDWMPENKGEFLIQSVFELFEVLLSYLSNTISFIRVGAFVLAHVGMMSAVFAIAELGGGSNPNLVTVVVGNVFVIALEGLIVGIQGLRLQFYEMFSRFYDGDGKPYEPVKISYDI